MPRQTNSNRRSKGKARRVPEWPPLRVHKVRKGYHQFYANFDGERRRYTTDRAESEAMLKADRAEWYANGGAFLDDIDSDAMAVGELVEAYLRHLNAEHDAGWHRRNGARVHATVAPLRELFGGELAADFGPKRLKAMRAHLLTLKKADGSPRLARKTINERVRMVREVFGWGVSEELLPATHLHALQSVRALPLGKPGTREGRKVRPVSREAVDAALPHMLKPVAGLVELMWHMGARPSELFRLTPAVLDRSGRVWRAELTEHKTAAKGCTRVLLFGPQSQRVLLRFLPRAPDSPLFDPREALAEWSVKRRKARQTPLYASHMHRNHVKREAAPDRVVGDTYTSDSLRKAVQRAVKAANAERKAQGLEPFPMWSPYALRHSAATRIRKEHGLEQARVILGHTSAVTTETYAEVDLAAAERVIEAAG